MSNRQNKEKNEKNKKKNIFWVAPWAPLGGANTQGNFLCFPWLKKRPFVLSLIHNHKIQRKQNGGLGWEKKKAKSFYFFSPN